MKESPRIFDHSVARQEAHREHSHLPLKQKHPPSCCYKCGDTLGFAHRNRLTAFAGTCICSVKPLNVYSHFIVQCLFEESMYLTGIQAKASPHRSHTPADTRTPTMDQNTLSFDCATNLENVEVSCQRNLHETSSLYHFPALRNLHDAASIYYNLRRHTLLFINCAYCQRSTILYLYEQY